MEKIAFVGKVVERKDYETRIVLTVLNKAQDKASFSFFKVDKYTPPEIMEQFMAISTGASGTFYYVISPDGKYKNLKGFDPAQVEDPPVAISGVDFTKGGELKIAPMKSNQPDGDSRTRSMAISYAKDLFIATPIDEDGCRRMTEDQMFELARRIEKYIVEG